MTKVVNKSDLTGAHQSKRLLDPAILALKEINTRVLNFDPYTQEKLNSFVTWLEKFSAKADGVISQAQDQYDNRPLHLINAAAIRHNAIATDIELEQKTAQGKIEAHQTKSEELRKQRFSESEILAILPYPQSELDAHANTITSLNTEQHKLGLFLADAPRWDTDLLKGAKLEPYLQNQEQAG